MNLPLNVGPASVAAFILFIGLLVFVHELGHFLVAKYFKIKVTKFSLGFGPPIFQFHRGDTTYQIAVVPLGGFVKMVGDNPGDTIPPEDQARAFNNASVTQRALVAVAGPVMNLLFPVLCFFAYNLLGPQVTLPIVGAIEIGQPAEDAGLKPGDLIHSVDGERAYSFGRLVELVAPRPGEVLDFAVQREDELLRFSIVPAAVNEETAFGQTRTRGMIGISRARVGTRIGVFDSSLAGSLRTGDRVLRVQDKTVDTIDALDRALRDHAGTEVLVSVGRPQLQTLGNTLAADHDHEAAVRMTVPQDYSNLSDLGVASGENFLRALRVDGAAFSAGLRPGDQVTGIDGIPIRLYWSFVRKLRDKKGASVKVNYKRDGKTFTAQVTPTTQTCVHMLSKEEIPFYDHGLGLGTLAKGAGCGAFRRQTYLFSHWNGSLPPATEKVRLSVDEAFLLSFRQTKDVVKLVGEGLLRLLSREISVDNVGGPIQLFKIAALAAEAGIFAYLRMLALISVNLGLINLLPIPIFDGGHLMFCAAEAIRRKPLSMRAREYASLVGLMLVVLLLLLALKNDIQSLGLF